MAQTGAPRLRAYAGRLGRVLVYQLLSKGVMLLCLWGLRQLVGTLLWVIGRGHFDSGDTAAPLNLNIVNQLGEVRIFVPRSWHVDLVNENSMGSVNCRPDGDITTRTIVIRVKNQMGDVGIVSED